MDLLDLLASDKKTIFIDGAMGTQLGEAGLEMGGQNCVTHPDEVLAVHRRYAECGIDLLITNTLTMNRVNIESHRIAVDVREVNLEGARLAREAAGDTQLVLGDMSSTGKMLRPYGQLSEDEAYEAFAEQAAVLEEGGVDGLIVETMIDLREALCALRAALEATALPVLATISFSTIRNGGRTVMGDSAHDCAQALTEAGACAVGANCGSLDPHEMAGIVATMRDATSLPLIAQPNAGKGRLAEKRLVFDMSPEAFAAGVRECALAGARLVGGCCGTSPVHIGAMIELLGGPESGGSGYDTSR
ncbi:MAG: homocysteine S-methyltransferase family protein [Thermoleophilia bacterium]|nr:homocysteine S-methyltransferase family protein [Thermoleophilia bacterium]